MTPGQDYAPCPHCNANNVTYRHVCWRCGYALPYIIGMDGKPRLNPEAAGNAVSQRELEKLLNQAETLDFVGAKRQHQEEAAAEADQAQKLANSRSLSRVLIWLRLRKERQSEA